MQNLTLGGIMNLKSSPILGTIGLLYGIFAGSVIAHTITKDNYELKEAVYVEYVYPNTIPKEPEPIFTIVTVVEVVIPPEIDKKIPNDISKRCPEWESELRSRGFPVKLFSYIMWRESRCNPKAHNTTLNRDKSRDLGLLQINSTWKTVTKNICGSDISELFNPDCNLKVAKYLYDNGGAGHWSM